MKTAIVTGGASGIGLAIAEKFCQQEVQTVLIGRNIEKLQQAADRLGPFAHPIAADLTQLHTLPALADEIYRHFGRIDILVNNAGINMKKPVQEVTDEDFQQVIGTNLTAVFALTREVARYMLPQKSGAVVNISSMAAQYGMPKVIAYSASKAAIEGMTRAFAAELSPEGIRVNAIAPGFIITEMTDRAFNTDPERKARALARTPMGHMGQPADIAEAAWFLSSDAARFITGVVLPVDGGNLIGF